MRKADPGSHCVQIKIGVQAARIDCFYFTAKQSQDCERIQPHCRMVRLLEVEARTVRAPSDNSGVFIERCRQDGRLSTSNCDGANIPAKVPARWIVGADKRNGTAIG